MFVNYYAFFVEYVADEVLTYEEVALLQPDPQRKRPVVLIGMLAQTASLKRSPFCPPSLVHFSCYDAVTGCLFPIIHRTVFYSFTWFSLWQEDSTILWSKSTKLYLLTSCILWQNAQDLSNFEVLNLQRNLRNYSFLSYIKPFHVCLELDLACWVNDKTISEIWFNNSKSALSSRSDRWFDMLQFLNHGCK